MDRLLHRLSPPALCAMAAICGGLIAGESAVHGLRPNSYGPLAPPTLIGQHEGAGDSGATYGEGTTAGCDDCSERDLGYRWAVLQAVRSPADCPNDSWGFRRGCLDYTGGI
ncbi:hypothetical protein [Rhizorhabdus argentea]|uniref:hypothetical protein n=1 Tax=Rhizorhabdus argentea TaxID=1387174 RepID=UPI0030EDE742